MNGLIKHYNNMELKTGCVNGLADHPLGGTQGKY